MGRINVTIRIFAGTLVPNVHYAIRRRNVVSCYEETHDKTLVVGERGQCCTGQEAMMRNVRFGQCDVHNTPLFVTVLAQDHCYSDLLRFVPTTNSLLRTAMIRKHCPSA